MRAALLFIALALCGCSLLVDPRGEHEYDLRDGGRQGFDGGERDAGGSGAVDAGPAIPAAPALRFPWNGYMTGSVHTGALPAARNALRPRFVWEPSEGTERYEVQLTSTCEAQTRESCAFEGAIDGVTTETEWRPDEALPVSMSAPVGRRYVWRARACNAAGCSGWSAVRYLDVGRQSTDFNGDGYADLLVGAPHEPMFGNAFVFRGPELDASRQLKTFIGGGPGSGLLGWTIGAVGDINADGFPDAVVSELVGSNGAVEYAGRAFLLAGLDDDIGLDVARPVVLVSPHPREIGLFGSAIGGAGDVDGDGFADFAIGAAEEDVDGLRGAGRAYLYRGRTSLSAIGDPQIIASPAPAPVGLFGYSVSIAGDIDGDGLADLVVGAPGESGAGTSHSGRVYVFAGSHLPLEAPMTIVSRSPAASGGFGCSIASSGDMNGDGRAELVIGAPVEGEGGSVHIFSGGAMGLEYTTAYLPADVAPGSAAGMRISTSGDFDGDGRRDLVLGALYDTGSQDKAGAVYVVFGADDLTAAPITRLTSPSAEVNGWFGVSVGGATDFDGDGYSELLSGALETVNGHRWAGRVHVYEYDGTGLVHTRSLQAPIPATDMGFGAAIFDTTVSGGGYDPI